MELGADLFLFSFSLISSHKRGSTRATMMVKGNLLGRKQKKKDMGTPHFVYSELDVSFATFQLGGKTLNGTGEQRARRM